MKSAHEFTNWRLWIVVAFLSVNPPLNGSTANDIPDVIQLAAHHQEQSMAVRDHTRYRQELFVQRFPFDSFQGGGTQGKSSPDAKKLGERRTVVTVEPSRTPDAQGRYEVLVRVVEDTDDQGRPKSKIDPKAQPGLLVEVLWDELFFPLQEEKLPFLKFEKLASNDPGVARFHFEPKVNPQTMILASGTISVDNTSGSVHQVTIEALHNLKSLNKQLGKLENISAQIKFAPFRGAWSFPAMAKGQGASRLPHLEGLFQFEFHESDHEPVMKIPETP